MRMQVRGKTLSVEKQGNGDPVVLLHGLGSTANVWEPQVRALSDRFTLLRLDLESRAAQSTLDSLASTADFLIATPQPGTADDVLFDIDRLHSVNPRLILVAITPFGLWGPKSQCRATDLEIMAAAGAMSLAGDIVLAARSSYFLQAFVNIGLVPDVGSSRLMTPLVERDRAQAMMMLGERIPAHRAQDWVKLYN